ncbi:HIT family domain protein, partial [Mycobacterium ulcerans str. Harvey]
MATIGQRIAKAARATELADATNIGINDGSAAFQTVFHIICTCYRARRDKLSVAKGLLLRRDNDREAPAESCATRWPASSQSVRRPHEQSHAVRAIRGIPILRLHDTIYRKTNAESAIASGCAAQPAAAHRRRQDRQARTTSLTSARDGDSYLIVASNGGDERYPGWYHNLRKRPDCKINVGPKRIAVTRGGSPPTMRTTSGCGSWSTRT